MPATPKQKTPNNLTVIIPPTPPHPRRVTQRLSFDENEDADDDKQGRGSLSSPWTPSTPGSPAISSPTDDGSCSPVPMVDDDDIAKTKAELLASIQKLDDEINQTESLRARLKESLKEFEENGGRSSDARGSDAEEESVSETVEPEEEVVHKSWKMQMLLDNRRLAFKAHKRFDNLIPASLRNQLYGNSRQKPSVLGPQVTPLYSQPYETELYRENVKRFPAQRDVMFAVLTKRFLRHKNYCRKLAIEYATVGKEWVEELRERDHSLEMPISPPIYPGASPRVNRRPDAARSEAEFEQIMAELQNQEMKRLKYERARARCPPMKLDPVRRRFEEFHSRNGFVEDPKAEERMRKNANPWTKEEETIFRAKFAKNPKQFRKISTYLPNKSVYDCVNYYYKMKWHFTSNKKLKGNKSQQQSSSTSIGGVRLATEPPAEGAGGSILQARNAGNLTASKGTSGTSNAEKKTLQVPGKQSNDESGKGKPSAHKGETGQKLSGKKGPVASQAPEETDEVAQGDLQPKKKKQKLGTEQVEVEQEMAGQVIAAAPAVYITASASATAPPNASSTATAAVASPAPIATAAVAAIPGLVLATAGPKAAGEKPVKEKTWTPAEKELFLKAVEQFGRDFVQLAQVVSTKSVERVKNYYKNNKKRLNLEELGRIPDMARAKAKKHARSENDGDGEPENSGDRPRQRNRGKRQSSHWTTEEKNQFLSALNTHGRVWKALSEAVPTRTQNQIKNFFQNYKGKLGLAQVAENAARRQAESSAGGESGAPTETNVKLEKKPKEKKSGKTASSRSPLLGMTPAMLSRLVLLANKQESKVLHIYLFPSV